MASQRWDSSWERVRASGMGEFHPSKQGNAPVARTLDVGVSSADHGKKIQGQENFPAHQSSCHFSVNEAEVIREKTDR